MGAHLINGEFQSDKYPTTPRGKVPLSCKDKGAQDLLWAYAERRRTVDAEFSDDLQAALKLAGFDPSRDYRARDAIAGRAFQCVAARIEDHDHAAESEERQPAMIAWRFHHDGTGWVAFQKRGQGFAWVATDGSEQAFRCGVMRPTRALWDRLRELEARER